MPELSLIRKKQDSQMRAYTRCCKEDKYRVEIPEWILPCLLLVVGVHMLMWPETARASHMAMLFGALSVYGASALCIWVGVGRLALVIIRHKSLGIFTINLRIFFAVVSGLIWLQMDYAFAVRFIGVGDIPPPGFEMLLMAQVITDFWIAYRLKMHLGQLRRKGVL